MPGHVYTVEELMLDESFIDYCLSKGSAIPSRWKNIIRENPAQQQIFEEAKRLVLALHGGISRPEVNRQIEVVRSRLEARKNKKAEPAGAEGPTLSTAFVITNRGQIKRRLLRRAVFGGAVLCVMITGILWLFVFKPVTNSSANASQPEPAQRFHSPLDQRRKIDLPDGSTVVLNSNSSITIDFGAQKREIRLNGDAFFRVAKDASKPFVVYAGSIAATALGTEFFIYSNDRGGNIKVDLLEGKVQLSDLKNSVTDGGITLNPGERGNYHEGSGLQKNVFDSVYLRSWIAGRIKFSKTPAIEALKQLEKWYGVRIEILKKDIENRPLTGEYPDEPLQNILDVICFSINSTYSFKGNKVIIE